MGPFQREIRERDACFLTELDDVETVVEIQVKERRSDLVEDGPASVLIRETDERANQLGCIRGRADRIAERNPTASVNTEHDESGAAFIEQERFVTQECELRGSLRILRDDRMRVTQIALGRAGHWLACGAHEPEDREYDQRCENASARAQKARSLRVSREVEESRDRDIEIGVRQQPECNRSERHQQNRPNPRRGETLFDQRAATIEVLAAWYERGQHQRENQSLLHVQCAEQRQHDSRDEHPDGEVVCNVQASLDTACEDEQHHTGEIVHEVGQLYDWKRNPHAQPSQPSSDRRCGAREQQERTGDEGEYGEHAGNDRRGAITAQTSQPLNRRRVPEERDGDVSHRKSHRKAKYVMMARGSYRRHCYLRVEMRNVTERKYMADSSSDLYLVTAPGLEHITASELTALGMNSGSE